MKKILCVLMVLLVTAAFAFAGGGTAPSAPVPSGVDLKQKEAPMLEEMVKAGTIPKLKDRLPENPVVVDVNESLGKYGGTLRLFMTPGNFSAMDRCTAYEEPLRWGPETGFAEALPNIFESWDVNAEETVFTFHMREGMKWSDGHPLTADDWMYQWGWREYTDDIKKTVNHSGYVKSGGKAPICEKIDDYTIMLTFEVPYGSFVQRLACVSMWYLFRPAHYCKQFDPKYTDRAIVDKQAKDAGFDNWYKYYSDITQWKYHPEVPCLNPWLVVTESPKDAQRIELERNPYYWKVDTEGRQLPYIDRVTFDAVANVDVALINTLNGDYDLIDYNINVMTNYTVLAENKAKGGYHFAVHKPALMNSAVVMVNHNHPDPVKNKLYNTPAFKFGLSHAINREEINQLVYSGTTFPRQCSPHEGSPFYDEEYANLAIEYDVAKANKYLDEAGLDKRDSESWRLMANGERLEMLIETSTDYHPEYSDVMELITKYWSAVNIKTTFKDLGTIGSYGKRMASLQQDVGIWHGDGGMEVLFERRYYDAGRGTWSSYAVDWGTWYSSKGERGTEPPQDMKDCFIWYDQMHETGDLAKQKALMSKILDKHKKNLWVIGTVSFPDGFAIVSDRLKNVPDWWWRSWMYPNPAPINMMQLYIEE